MTSTPAPAGAARSTAQPSIANDVAVANTGAGVSRFIAGSEEAIVIVTLAVGANAAVSVLWPYATTVYVPGARLPATENPEGPNRVPYEALTSSRRENVVAAPRNAGAPPLAGKAQTCTASSPVPSG